ncbi:MAG: efflux RND transporter periplasmic adaptor subunit [Prochloraceae cyanobacterium]|nr:efflux RND transporter periplasmic adaptor subunit [Prochloraceae cyanobacterium]
MNSSKSPPDVKKFEDSEQTLPSEEKIKSNPLQKLLVILLLVASGSFLWHVVTPKENSSPSQAAIQAPRPRPVETAALKQGEGVRKVNIIGQVQASRIATIRAQTTGIVQQVLVREGDRVSIGSTIAILDNADQQLALREAQARLATERSRLARLEMGTRQEIIAQRRAAVSASKAREKEAVDNLQRVESLVREGALSQRSLVEARSAVDSSRGERLEAAATLAEAVAGPLPEDIAAQRAIVAAARAAVNQARLQLDRTRIKAISNGIVQSRQVSPGDYLEIADPVVSVVDGTQVEIFLEIPEELITQVRPGMSVKLYSRALPNWQGRSQITAVIPSAEEGSRRQLVRIGLDNPPQGLISGMAVRGELELPIAADSYIISRDALVRRGNKWLVFTVANDRAKEHEVQLVADMGLEVAITSEQLQNGQQVVVRGGDGLNNGAPVKTSDR